MSAYHAAPGTRYGPWTTIRYLGEGRHLCRCECCGEERPMTTHALGVAARRDYAGCTAGRRRRAEERRAERQRRREARHRVWTGSEWITMTEAADRIGLTRQRVHQLVQEHGGDLSHRFEAVG